MNPNLTARKLDACAVRHIAETLESGVIFVDAEGEALWADERTRLHTKSGLPGIDLPGNHEKRACLNCFVTVIEVELEGKPRPLCVIQARSPGAGFERDLSSLGTALSDVMADPSWLTLLLLDKIKAWYQAAQPAANVSDLAMLTSREREILVLICEGHSDAQMSRLLKLSPNTVRNHVASLFKKIGVNRRSAAVIWARERAITRHDVLAVPHRKRAQAGQRRNVR